MAIHFANSGPECFLPLCLELTALCASRSLFLEQSFRWLCMFGRGIATPPFTRGLTGFSGGEMIRIRSGNSSVMVELTLNSERRMGCSDAMKLRAISSFATRVWKACRVSIGRPN